jgi:hypothetical protein
LVKGKAISSPRSPSIKQISTRQGAEDIGFLPCFVVEHCHELRVRKLNGVYLLPAQLYKGAMFGVGKELIRGLQLDIKLLIN